MELLNLLCLVGWARSLESRDNCLGQYPMRFPGTVSWTRFTSVNRMRKETPNVKLQVGDICEGGGRRQKLLERLEHLTQLCRIPTASTDVP